MGCNASKSSAATNNENTVVTTSNPVSSSSPAAAPNTIGKKGSSKSKDSSSSAKRNNNKPKPKGDNKQQQPSSSFSPTNKLKSGSGGSGSGNGGGNSRRFLITPPQIRGSKNSKSGSKDAAEDDDISRVYRLLLATVTANNGSNLEAANSTTPPTSSSRKKKKKRGSKKNQKNDETTYDIELISAICTIEQASYQDPTTGYTPLHLVCSRLLLLNNNNTEKKEENGEVEDAETAAAITSEGSSTTNANKQMKMIPSLVERLLELYPDACRVRDKHGQIPLHYAIAPPTGVVQQQNSNQNNNVNVNNNWIKIRTSIVKLLLVTDLEISQQYLLQTNVKFDTSENENNENITNAIGTVDSDDYENNATTATDEGNNIRTSGTGGCSPLYHVIETLPDDFDPHGPTVEHLNMLRNCLITTSKAKSENSNTNTNYKTSYVVISQPNDSDGDQPLALLYRRFTRQFDLAEKFFDGDNSRPEVVRHRLKYKTAAGNTWRMIELLLRPDRPSQRWRIVHRAVQVETPPDLLRYIVETNAEDLTVPDDAGNLPLHYAASSKPSRRTIVVRHNNNNHNNNTHNHKHHHHCCYNTYTKYVMDELLYKFPEAASIPNSKGQFALYLAVEAGKPWIGGGIKSLYEAHPPALKQIDLKDHPNLKRALRADGILEEDGTMSTIGLLEDESSNNDDDDDDGDDSKEEKVDSPSNNNKNSASNFPGTSPRPRRKDKVIRDEPHDAIMRIQEDDVDVSEIVTNMWAHEEDPGVQMLGCVAVSKLIMKKKQSPSSSDDPVDTDREILRIALSAVAGVVNAMKAHPNEVIVQEKACQALLLLAPTDGQREVSFVASGAVSAIVGAMQAHVSDPAVQEQACGAVAAIVKYGGGERATIVASVSGLTAILNAIAAHPDVVGVQKEGCRALMELTEYSSSSGGEADHCSANLPELPRSQAEPLIEAAKEKFPNECGRAVDTILSRLTS